MQPAVPIGFWQGEGRIVFIWQQPDWQGELWLVLSHQFFVGMLSLADDVLQLQQVLLGIFDALFASLNLQVELGNLTVELLPLGLQLQQLLADRLADAAQVLHMLHLTQLIASPRAKDALAGIICVIDGRQVVVPNKGKKDKDDKEDETQPGKPDPTGPPQQPRLASVPHSPIPQHCISSHEFNSHHMPSHVGSVAITKRVCLASLYKETLLCLLNEKPIEREFHLVVTMAPRLDLTLPTLCPPVVCRKPAGSVTAFSWRFKDFTSRGKARWDQGKLYRCSRHPALPSNEYAEAPAIVENEPEETRTNIGLIAAVWLMLCCSYKRTITYSDNANKTTPQRPETLLVFKTSCPLYKRATFVHV